MSTQVLHIDEAYQCAFVVYVHVCPCFEDFCACSVGAEFRDTARSLCPFLLDKLKDKNKGVVEATHAALDCMIEYVLVCMRFVADILPRHIK
jgi:hypothetical protein